MRPALTRTLILEFFIYLRGGCLGVAVRHRPLKVIFQPQIPCFLLGIGLLKSRKGDRRRFRNTAPKGRCVSEKLEKAGGKSRPRLKNNF